MQKNNIAFLINPKAGRKHGYSLDSRILMYLDNDLYDPTFFYTEHPGHGRELSAQLFREGFRRIVAVGGDGTVNEVASALAGTDGILGIIPTGSGNGLARHLGISIRIKNAVEVLNSGKTTLIDAGKINGKWFFCTCGVGFDARVGNRFAKRKHRGFITYVRTTIREFFRYRPKKYKMKIDDQALSRKAFLITVANASQYGNNAFIAPGAAIDDGFLDVCILKPFPRYRVIHLGLQLLNRKLEQSAYMEILRAKTITFKKPKKKYIFHFDGEPCRIKGEKVCIKVHPQVLQVMV